MAIGRRGLGTTSLLAAGIAWGVVVFVGMWFVVVPLVDPLLLNLNAFVFLAGHMMWGAALGFLWDRLGTADRPYALKPM